MSTKTTIKRIALVAAVAAAFGGLSTVAANATTESASITVTAATSAPNVAVGTPITFAFSETDTATVAGGVETVTAHLAVAPHSGLTDANVTDALGGATNATAAVTAGTSSSGVITTITEAAVGAVSNSDNYTFTPDVAGTYTLTVTPSHGNVSTAVVTAIDTAPLFLNLSEDHSVIGVSSSTGNALTAISGGFAEASIEANSAPATDYITVTGGQVIAETATGGVLNNSSGLTGVSNSLVWTTAAGTDLAHIQVYSAVAGVATITVTPVSATTGVPGTPVVGTITFGAAPVVSAQYSTAYIADGTTPATSTSQATSTLSYSKSAATQVANIQVTLNSAASTAIFGQGLAVSVSGPGLVGLFNDATGTHVASGKALSFPAASGIPNTFSIPVWADGTSGTSTITITSGTTTIATKTVTFTGSPAKASATQNLFIAAPGAALGANPSTYLLEAGVVGNGKTDPAADSATSGTAAIVGTVVDSNGNAVAGAIVKLVSSNTAVITAGSCLEVTNGTYAAPGTWQCQVSGAPGALSGQTATVTFEVYNPTTAAYDILATPLTFSIGKATVVSEDLTTDAASYSALAPMIITVTAKDSAGNLVADQDGSSLATLVSSTQLGGTLASPTKLVNGIGKIKTAYAPAVAGSFTISALDNLSVAGEAVSVTAASAGGSADTQAAAATDAANEATDAANAATDAANAAADAADAATAAAQDAGAKADAALAAVTALSAKITVLAAQIAKIVKKLKA
jgi:hypothetical protein